MFGGAKKDRLPLMKEKKLQTYRELVEQMFNEESSELISNKDTDHAQILIETMIDRASERLSFFCHDLNPCVYEKPCIGTKLVAAGLRGVKIRILTQKEPASDLKNFLSPWLSGENEVQFKLALPDSEAEKAVYNFVVMDGKAFRFETDRNNHVASASANNPRIAKNIEAKFEQFWQD